MDILTILKESGKDLYLEDLNFFVAELDTGEGYDNEYKESCLREIEKLKNWKKGIATTDEEKPASKSRRGRRKKVTSLDSLELDFSDINPENVEINLSLPEQVIRSVRSMRKSREYKRLFKKYVKNNDFIDSDFVDKNFAIFDPWEIDAIVSVKQMDEDFLEKYFGAISHEVIARHQKFSESFFMKHFSQLDADIVLTYGKNTWKDSAKRSKQLDVFLRLKGVNK